MSKLPNAPLVEAIFEMKWGASVKSENGIALNFSEEETSLLPGKFQVIASETGFSEYELLKNNPPIPHLVKHRYRKEPNGYPLIQIGTGIMAINQTDFDGNEYDWDTFKDAIRAGLEVFEKSYPYKIETLPLLDIQLRYRDVLEMKEGQCPMEFITDNFDIGALHTPTRLVDEDSIDTTCPLTIIKQQYNCNNPKGKILYEINQGVKDDKQTIVIDFLVISNFNEFTEISIDSLMQWCAKAKDQNKRIFKAVISNELMETFK